MKPVRMLLGALLGALPIVASAQPAREPVVYEAPAQNLPTGRLGADPYAAVLPSGRLIKPAGRSVVVGIGAVAAALAPDGRYAIVANGDGRLPDARSAVDPSIAGGSSLSVVDVAGMTVTEQYARPGQSFAGVVAARDPADPERTVVLASGGAANVVYAFTLDEQGRLHPDPNAPQIAIPGPDDPLFADAGQAAPSTLVLGRDGKTAYVVNAAGASVSAIDLRTRRLRGTASAGFFPFAAAAGNAELLVCNEGLMRYGVLAHPALAPAFRVPPPDIERASSLSLVPLDASGNVGTDPSAMLAMDRPPDGTRIAGGVHPSAVAVDAAGTYAYVALASVDRIAIVDLTGTPRVLGGLDLRLFPLGPYGTQPLALALSSDGKRLYVALAGLDAVAVIDSSDPVHLKRLGLIPTGWYPSALALSSDDRTLFVANAKGFGSDFGFAGDKAVATDPGGRVLQVGIDAKAVWSTFESIDLTDLNLVRGTYTAIGSARVPKPWGARSVVPPLGAGASRTIKHVVMILEEGKTFDAMLGDLTDGRGLRHGNGDPSMVAFDASVTPNLHALARTFALADNFYADAQDEGSAHQFALGGIASAYAERAHGVRQDPEDYPRFGSIFNTLALHNLGYRAYGDPLRLSGYDDGNDPDPKADDPSFAGIDDRLAPTLGLGGLYAYDVPAPAILSGHVDERYPGWNLRIRDERRAREFVRDFDLLAARGAVPRYTLVWLPDDRGGKGTLVPPLAEEVADGDRALGIVVSHITHMAMWKDTAIFILPADSESSRDHVSVHRAYAVVVSPYAKRGYVGHRHLSTVSALKTQEELLGLPPLSLGDLLATDMSDFFTARPLRAPYVAKPVPPAAPAP